MEGLKKLGPYFGWASLACAFGAVAAFRFLLDTHPWAVTAFGAGVLVFFAAFVALEWKRLAAQFRSGRVQSGLNAFLFLGVAAGILGVANYIAAVHNPRWDFTSNSIHTLAEQSRNVAAGLKSDVRVYAFLRDMDGTLRREFNDLAALYRHESGRILPEIVNPLEKPDLTEKYKIEEYGTVVFDMNGSVRRAAEISEEAFTKALIELTTGQSRTVYFLQGHGERSMEGEDNTAVTLAARRLESLNYAVKPLSLLEKQEIPEDSAALVIAGPSSAPLDRELEILRDYVEKRGGRVLVMLERASPRPWREWLLPFGIRAEDALIVDPVGQAFLRSAFVAVAASYSPAFEATKNFGVASFFPTAIPLRADRDAAAQDLMVYSESFVFTDPRAWGERDEGVYQFDEKKDLEGPLELAAYATVAGRGEGAAEGRVAAVGDADFASNGYTQLSGNLDLFANLVNWLAERESLIGVAPNKYKAAMVNMSPAQESLVVYSSIFGLPLLAAVLGFAVWNRRRNL